MPLCAAYLRQPPHPSSEPKHTAKCYLGLAQLHNHQKRHGHQNEGADLGRWSVQGLGPTSFSPNEKASGPYRAWSKTAVPGDVQEPASPLGPMVWCTQGLDAQWLEFRWEGPSLCLPWIAVLLGAPIASSLHSSPPPPLFTAGPC